MQGLRSQHFEKMRMFLWPKKLPRRSKSVALCRFTDVAFVTCLLNKKKILNAPVAEGDLTPLLCLVDHS